MREPFFGMALILGLLAAVGPFAIDMYLPALPRVAEDLGTGENVVALTLAVYLLTFGLAQMVYGPMSDAVGRRVPMAIGVGIFAAAAVAAALAPTIGWMLASRALQGLGAATLMVVPRAVVRDMATGPEATRIMAAIMIVMSVSPMLAPLAGSLVLVWGGWREIFLLLAVAALFSLTLIVLVLPETHPAGRRQTLRLVQLWEGSKALLCDPRFMGFTMIGAFGTAGLFVYISTASFVYISQYGLSPIGFSLAFAVNAMGFFAASQFAGRLAESLGMERLIALALHGFAATSLILTGLVWAGADVLPVVVSGLFLAFACLGLVIPAVMVMSLDPHPDMAGLASSIGGTVQMLTGGLMIALTGPFMDSSVLPMAGAIAVCASLAWAAAVVLKPWEANSPKR
ncbi:multidrug effflux MFS transporter [Hephaestia sp. GCM10023244]|uniref:multidrug effflux MFS transporter n=1 Tax=unclassified Hephaestia TaxID=2631281 RepID=UPI00207742C0|nr:multidrug effflux MFS transporter [Hephaestia sp. MAHUQ-44]MCM8732505.1 multidrug effflux MFS transporter [Hephaestia sp. MAHUQ-44]